MPNTPLLEHWRAVPALHRRWILVNSVIISGVWNLFINGFIAWVSSKGHGHIGLWTTPLLGGPNLLIDTFGTLYLLPLTTCIGVMIGVRQAKRKGQLHNLEDHQKGPRWLTDVPTTFLRRANRFGLMVLLPLGPIATIVLSIGFHSGIERSTFVVYKAVIGVLLGLIVTPFIALSAMGDEHIAGEGIFVNPGQ
ncbi:MAG TPA: hypothetical protein VHV57_03050 [Acidimicrobiales bacterium]|jgi:hypothetical protein|nr:hypothetical protein [Acidimicrobiales bacterium]